ncbi:FlaA1/EpsC-like NDP-sugar epimerase [Flavobacterium aquaticum]|uniref:FlaA1/EpsC-like NDP-sugar epimerase n=1 Tax=Flavobacterium aquaticum TaxID=1236486 RepID=A0A327YQC5_9FLAO|nr:nucleoside-diphosphate sugar epimerase/dehydratase [Flavobacterium aquaticum]RAK22711.1 FlaA1/EpsC-like NDP-sugar epimerase [Flavobacterium aquaticum]
MSNNQNNSSKKSVIQNIAKDFFENRFSNLAYLPRWVIFCIDIIIVLFASLVTYFIVTNLTYKYFDTYSVSIRYVITIFTYAFFFFAFRTYAGIIRHSSFIDGMRLLLATSFAFFSLVVLNYTHYFIHGTKIFLLPELFIHSVISFVLLFLFRIVVKFLFETYIELENIDKIKKIVVFGVDANAFALAKALHSEQPKRFKVVAFIEKTSANKTKQVLGLPIVGFKGNAAVIIRKFNASGIILSDSSLTKSEQLKIVDDCLEHQYQVLSTQTVKNWEDQKNITKSIRQFDIKDLLERQPIELHNQIISGQISGKTIMVTGAAGSIGSEIVQQVLDFKPSKLVVVDQAETPLHQLGLLIEPIIKNIPYLSFVADIKDAFMMEQIIGTHQPDVIYHAAAYKHVPLMELNPYQAVLTNVYGTKIIADLALKYKVSSFVMVSTDKAVNPSNVMGASKRIAEMYVQSLSMNAQAKQLESTKFITTRFGNVLGSNGSVVPLFTKQIQEGGPITITHPDIIRYFMTIPEACQLVLEAGSMGNGGEIYIFDMGEPVRIIDLAYKMIRLAGFTPEEDIKIEVVGLRPGEKLYEELLNDVAKTLPTHHEKIMIAQEVSVANFDDFLNQLQRLVQSAKEMKSEETVVLMKKIVPEFKSKNSEFERLDH